MISKHEIKQIQDEQSKESTFVPRLFSALGDTTRWRMFLLLIDYKDLCVTDLANVLRISVPAASQHLRTLELSGLISKKRMGQSMCYHVQSNSPATSLIVRVVKSLRAIP